MNNPSNLEYIFNNLMDKLIAKYDFPFSQGEINKSLFLIGT